MEFIHQPSSANRLGDYLKDNLSKPWTDFRAATAFVKRSGTRHVAPALAAFSRIGHTEVVAGIDHRGTSAEGLQDLLDAVSPRGRVIVFHNRLPFTFHPKVYLFKSPTVADIVIGSGNLTEGGLFTNYEAALRLPLDLTDPGQASVLQSIEHVLDGWADLATGTALTLDDTLLARLTATGLVPLEVLASPISGEAESGMGKAHPERADPLFSARPVPRAPPSTTRDDPSVVSALALASSSASDAAGFVMTLQRTDVGVGQTTAGTSRRSPEIFIPLAARDANPEFWGWPEGFVPDPEKPGKRDRHGVPMRLGGEIISVNMMTWPDKHDFRLRSEALRSAGNIGDILRMEKANPGAGYEYYAEVIPKETTQHPVYLALCRHSVRNSQKTFGYY